jgi:hypothetical protein
VYISSDPAHLPIAGVGVRSLPHQDVLVETFEAGESMIDIMSASKDASSVEEEDSRGAHLKHMYNKEIAALGLDAILKMVSARHHWPSMSNGQLLISSALWVCAAV